MSEDDIMVSPEANAKFKQSLEKTYREGIQAGMQIAKDIDGKKSTDARYYGTSIATGMVIGYVLGTMF